MDDVAMDDENLRFMEELRGLAAGAPEEPLTIEGLRRGFEETFRPLNADVPGLARREERVIPGPGGEIPVLVQAPTTDGRLPVPRGATLCSRQPVSDASLPIGLARWR